MIHGPLHAPRAVHCSRCGERGHYAPRCPNEEAAPGLRAISSARGDQAAAYLAEVGGTLEVAAAAFGVRHQAVQQAWRRLFGDRPTPVQARRAAVRAQAVELAREGLHAAEIERRIGLDHKAVAAACARAGVGWRKRA